MRFLWVAIFWGVLIWSGIHPRDEFTWFLEVSPALAGFILLAATYKYFRFTRLAYTLILLHCLILMVGAHHTYADVPLFNWLRNTLHLSRNHYDKVGHFVQGFVPAILVREVLIRKHVIPSPAWRRFFVVCFCLSLSAVYELFEWVVAITTGESAEAFLGTQGYVWDTQSDMAFALLGAVLALVTLSSFHDRQIEKITT
jgi:putative membrane protein